MKYQVLTLFLAVAFLTCSPTEPCACTVLSAKAEITGIVRTLSGQPIAGALVRSYARAVSCPASQPWADALQRPTNAAGEYLLIGYDEPPAAQFCLRVVGWRSPADSVVVETLVVDTVVTANGLRRFRVDLTFP